MDISKLKQLSPFSWTLPIAEGESRAPVLLYGTRELLETMDDKVLEQISNVATLPGLVGSAMTMPDAHWGYGFPIGGVAAFDADAGGIISAGGVGFDISCGIRCLHTGLTKKDVLLVQKALAHELSRSIPAGVGSTGTIRLGEAEMDAMLAGGARWAVERGWGEPADLRSEAHTSELQSPTNL